MSEYTIPRLTFNADGTVYEGNKMFLGTGYSRWCAKCGVHRPQEGGTTRMFMGGRHFFCKLHPKPDSTKKVETGDKSAV